MPDFSNLPKAYSASEVEGAIYEAWEKSGVFKPQGKGEPYCIVMPPPNRTGVLHIGHAVMLALQDILIRYHRMRGKKTLWIPGTDHAAIATQVKVEQRLREKGRKNPRQELGREKFLEEVVKFAEASRDTIVDQVRKMGSSCDWEQEKYTLDEERSRAVNAVFKMMYEDGIIERGYRIVNWDTRFQTTLSDDEVETKEMKARLLTFKYDKDFPIAISTTRPETKFGDTAVAVHPDDERYKAFVGKTFAPTFCGKKLSIKIIADAAVDPAFGTGALGVTPAHSMIDAEMAERHGLPTIQVIDKEARMIAEAVGEGCGGLMTVAVRQKIEEMLRAQRLLEKVEEVPQNLPVAQRGGAPVEQLPMEQWFVRVNKKFELRQDTLGKWKKGESATLKELMRYTVESGQISVNPERFQKIYFHWIDNLRDWCISRQIWFGHRIPVWYHESKCVSKPGRESEVSQCVERVVSAEQPVCEHCDVGYEQDPDTLDTWFSSGLWTFSTLGWPDEKEWMKNRAYHPTAVLETGYDILFFWVARMILMSSYVLGEAPFKDVYLHGLVRDEQGRKMSKSLGNVIDPLDVIKKYGTDAVRLSLVMGTTPGQDVKLSEQKIEGFRNFTNKLWNISRFVLMQIGEVKQGEPKAETLADQWILEKLSRIKVSLTKKIETYQFSSAGEELRDFTWSDLADWYLEIAKIEKGKEHILSYILENILKLWHPFMPFVTEYIWKIAGYKGDLITADWPQGLPLQISFNAALDRFEKIKNFVSSVRQFRSFKGIEPAIEVECAAAVDGRERVIIEQNIDIVQKLSRIKLKFVKSLPENWAPAHGFVSIALNIHGSIDEKEQKKIQKEIAELEKYVSLQSTKLADNEFVSKAPAQVVENMKSKVAEAEKRLKALKGKTE